MLRFRQAPGQLTKQLSERSLRTSWELAVNDLGAAAATALNLVLTADEAVAQIVLLSLRVSFSALLI
ncbi:MAG: hypothetical protein ACK5X9_13425, partial [Alphaproteobacteria bacterium]